MVFVRNVACRLALELVSQNDRHFREASHQCNGKEEEVGLGRKARLLFVSSAFFGGSVGHSMVELQNSQFRMKGTRMHGLLVRPKLCMLLIRSI